MSPPTSPVVSATLLALSLAGSGLAADIEGWSAVESASRDDLEVRVARGMRHLTRDIFDELALELAEPELQTDGADFRVWLPRISLSFQGLRGWDGELTGRLTSRDVLLAYGPLGVGDCRFLSDARFEAKLLVDVPSLLDHMEDRHFSEARMHFPEASRSTVLAGELDVGFLFFSWDPKVRVEGYFARRGERFVFHPTETEVQDAPGMVRRKVHEKLARKSRRGFGLEEGLGTLRDRGLPLGTVHLSHVRDGDVLHHQELPRLPAEDS